MRPIIGITSNCRSEHNRMDLSQAYVNAIITAGGAPVVLPNKPEIAADLLSVLDGVLFSGGGDVDAKHFNQPLHEKADGICEKRDEFELTLIKLVRAQKKPCFGICRGLQSMNVGLGGDLIQHIEGHNQEKDLHKATHKVDVVSGSKLEKITSAQKIPVNTFHHQLARTPGEDIVISAISEDGYVEAIEYSKPDWFMMAVQWHPELMIDGDLENNEVQLKIMKAFVDACKK